jgi:hypothetical protein
MRIYEKYVPITRPLPPFSSRTPPFPFSTPPPPLSSSPAAVSILPPSALSSQPAPHNASYYPPAPPANSSPHSAMPHTTSCTTRSPSGWIGKGLRPILRMAFLVAQPERHSPLLLSSPLLPLLHLPTRNAPSFYSEKDGGRPAASSPETTSVSISPKGCTIISKRFSREKIRKAEVCRWLQPSAGRSSCRMAFARDEETMECCFARYSMDSSRLPA